MEEVNNHLLFQNFYEEYKQPLFRYLMHRLNFDKSLAEDLFMDVILKAYENFDRFDCQKGSFKTWIFTIAHNHLLNFWRDKKETISLEVLEESGMSIILNEPETNDDENIMKSTQIKEVLSKLSIKEREIIILRFLNELKINEIAEKLKKKKGTVRTELSRALKRFRYFYVKLYYNKN